MQMNAIDFEKYELLQDEVCAQRIVAAKQKLGKRTVILAHHYQRADVYQHADLTGDSLKLSYLAAQTDADYLVFCGVHFMAEVADILSSSEQVVILPDLSAGCSMADMANLAKVERAWRELAEVLDPDALITPVTYINSSADLKAFCGEHGGIVCTSSNATKILQWSFAQREKVLFFPDQHLGRWSGHQMGLSLEEMPVWDFDEPMGGLTPEQIDKAKILLWKGHCSVHQMFQPQHILRFRNQHPDGLVISHPECSFEVCKASDFVGSTEYIINTIREAEPGTRWLVGTELNLVGRIAEEFKSQGKMIQFMSPMVCMCSTMARIDPQHLAWSLENLVDGRVVNQIKVPEREAKLARLTLEKMLAVSK
jgi:quinolinate synthase